MHLLHTILALNVMNDAHVYDTNLLHTILEWRVVNDTHIF